MDCLMPQRLLFAEKGKVEVPCGFCENCMGVKRSLDRERRRYFAKLKGGELKWRSDMG